MLYSSGHYRRINTDPSIKQSERALYRLQTQDDMCLYFLSVCLFTFLYFFNRISAPSAPPSRFGVTALDSQSLLVYWLDVPPEHRNGIIRGYRIAYRSSSNGTATVITRRAYSEVLTQLQKATEYTIQVWAFTDAGDGVSASYTTWTAEDGKLHEGRV